MKKFTINGQMIYNAIVSGAVEIIKNKQELNRINVFPVADGDTGSNLSATMKGVLEHMKPSHSVGLVMKTAADGALISARGNSGIIFAQLLYGFYLEVHHQHELDHDSFVLAINKASERLQEVVLSPVEGTILTVVRNWVTVLKNRQPLENEGFEAYVEFSLRDCEAALLKTQEQMPLLKARRVVDSGAKGFYHFLEGINNFIQTGEVPKTLLVDSVEHFEKQSEGHEERGAYRYCCETLIRADRNLLDLQEVRNRVQHFGDSLIVAGGNDCMRIHMHTNNPEQLFGDLAGFGILEGIKVDDMHLQVDVVNQRLSKIAIVTDSIADLPEGFCESQQVFMVPLQFEIDGVTHLDRTTMSVGRFYEMNPFLKEHPKSSLPPIKNVENLFNFLSDHYEGILVLSVSDKLSGTYNLFKSVAEMMRKRNVAIEVINTKLNSGAQGLVVKKLTELANGGMSFNELVCEGESFVKSTKILVAVNTVKYLARSGRVSHQAGKIAALLKLKPIMTLDAEGYGKAYGGALSFERVMNKIIKQVKKDQILYGIESFSIVHAASRERAEVMEAAIEKATGIKNSYISEISAIVGATAGEGAVAVSYMMKELKS